MKKLWDMAEKLTCMFVLMKAYRHVRIQNYCWTINGWPPV